MNILYIYGPTCSFAYTRNVLGLCPQTSFEVADSLTSSLTRKDGLKPPTVTWRQASSVPNPLWAKLLQKAACIATGQRVNLAVRSRKEVIRGHRSGDECPPFVFHYVSLLSHAFTVMLSELKSLNVLRNYGSHLMFMF